MPLFLPVSFVRKGSRGGDCLLVARGRCSFVLSSDVDIWFTSDEAKTELTQKKLILYFIVLAPP